MATNPSFASFAIKSGVALLGNAETSLTAPTTTSTLVSAGTNGSKIEEIRLRAVGTTVAGMVYAFLHDGSNYRLFDVYPVLAITSSSTVAPWDNSESYQNLWIPSGWSLRISQSIAGNASIIVASVFGGDY